MHGLQAHTTCANCTTEHFVIVSQLGFLLSSFAAVYKELVP